MPTLSVSEFKKLSADDWGEIFREQGAIRIVKGRKKKLVAVLRSPKIKKVRAADENHSEISTQ